MDVEVGSGIVPSAAVPAPGLWSGMLVTQIAAAAAVAGGLLVPGVERVFGAPPSRALLDVFLVTVALMAAHKLESFLTREFDVCPVYLHLGRSWAGDPRRAGFAVFVTTFLAAMLLLALTLRGAPWPLLVLGIWCAQGLHELHHAAKTLARRRYYPGTVTGLVFTAAVDLLLFPRWAAQLQGADLTVWRASFYAVQPLLLVAFYLEDRRWLAQLRQTGLGLRSRS